MRMQILPTYCLLAPMFGKGEGASETLPREASAQNKKPIEKSTGFPEIWCPEEDSNLHASRH